MNSKASESKPTETELLTRIHKTLQEVARWTKIANFETFIKLRKLLVAELSDDNKKLAYQLTDGENSRRDIANVLGISDSTVRGWWEGWYEIGIVEPSEKYGGGRPRRMVSLEDVGLEVPKIPKKQAEPTPAAQVGEGSS